MIMNVIVTKYICQHLINLFYFTANLSFYDTFMILFKTLGLHLYYRCKIVLQRGRGRVERGGRERGETEK